MRIYNFVKPELDYFREMCNFSEEEMTFFNYRAQHYSHHDNTKEKLDAMMRKAGSEQERESIRRILEQV